MSDKNVSDKKTGSTPKMKDTGFALACWILVALILLVFFFVKKDTVVSNLRHTNFVNRVMGRVADGEGGATTDTSTISEGTADGNIEDADEDNADDEALETAINMSNISSQSEGIPSLRAEGEVIASQVAQEVGARGLAPIQSNAMTETASPPSSLPPPSSASAVGGQSPASDSPPLTPMPKPVITESTAKPAATMNVKLCFVVIDSDGMVSRHISERALPKTTSPLTASINALLTGPTDGSQTLIPDGTRLLGAEVRGGLATLNFSEEFAFNPVGVEGYMAQLMQVVYTATSFSTVSSVQIVINGQHVDYLGSEGEWIGSPLSRASFR